MDIREELRRAGYKLIPQPEEVYVLYFEGKPFSLSPLSWEERHALEEELGRTIWKCNGTTRKVYFTPGRANAGIKQLPKCLRDKVEVVKYIKESK